MKYIVFLVVAISFTTASIVPAEDLKDKAPKTKVEEFIAKTGVVIIKGFEEAGTAHGKYGTSITVDSREYLNITTGNKEYGISIEVKKEDGRYDKDHTSYVDYDEIDSLIKGIDYISKANNESTKLANFQADYSTRGDLEISVFSSSGKIMLAITSGNIGSVRAYYDISAVPDIRNLIVTAKKKLDSIK